VPPLGFHRFHRYDIVKQEMMRADQSAPTRAVIDRAGEALRGGHRVFVVGGLQFPAGAAAPMAPPRAPVPGSDPWPEGAYNVHWSRVVGHFLRKHSTIRVELPVKERVSDYERGRLLVAEGWRP